MTTNTTTTTTTTTRYTVTGGAGTGYRVNDTTARTVVARFEGRDAAERHAYTLNVHGMTTKKATTKKTKLTVATDLGTFTRTTARDYAFVVVVKDERADWLEAERVGGLANGRRLAAKYETTIRTGINPDERRNGHPASAAFDRKCTIESLADGSYAKWLAEANARIAELESRTITADRVTDAGVYGWTSRIDLARKLAATATAGRHRIVRIYSVVNGTPVR